MGKSLVYHGRAFFLFSLKKRGSLYGDEDVGRGCNSHSFVETSGREIVGSRNAEALDAPTKAVSKASQNPAVSHSGEWCGFVLLAPV